MDEKTNEAKIEIHDAKVSGAPKDTPPEKPKKIGQRLRRALIRVTAVFLAVIILLAITGFSFFDLIRGPKESDVMQQEELGTFVKRDVFAILGFYADEVKDSGKYAVVPMGNGFVTVHFTKRYVESADVILQETNDYINGKMYALDKYVVVQGTTEKLDEDLSAKMLEWFEQNKDWMIEAHIIADTGDIGDYITDTVLMVDTVNSMNQNLVFVLTGLAALGLLYIIAELILMAAGFYLGKPRREEDEARPNDTDRAKTIDDRDAEEKELSKNAEPEDEKGIEDDKECINNGDESENTGSSDISEEESSEKPEDK